MAGLLRYEVRVVGAAKAARQIDDLDTAVEKVAVGMGRIDGSTATLARGFDETAEAAKAADRAFAKAAAAQDKLGQGSRRASKEVEGLGGKFDGLNDRLNRTWGRAGDVISRVGDLEDMIRIFSGFVLLDAIQTAGAFVQEMYRMTDAGRKAQSMAEGLAEGLRKVTTGLDSVDIRKSVQLAAAMGKSKEQANEYQRALDAAIDRQVELNARIEEKQKLEEQGKTDSYEYRNTLRNIEILTKAVEDQISVAEVERKKAQDRAFAAGQVNRALEGQIKANRDLIPNLLQSAEATAKAAIETAKYRVELQNADGAMTSSIDVFARLAAAGVKTWQGINAATAGHDKDAKKSAEEAKRLAEMRIRISQDLEDRQTALIASEGAQRLAQLDIRQQRELQAFRGTAEQRKRLVELQTDEMIALERELEQRAATEREAAARAELDQRIAMITQGAARAAAASQLSLQALAGDPGAGSQEGINARAKLQREAAMAAATAEIKIAQAKGEEITQIEIELQTKLLQIEQERVEASKALGDQMILNAKRVADGATAAAEAIGALGSVASQLSAIYAISSEASITRARAAEDEAAAEVERAKAAAKAAGEDVEASATVAAAEEKRLAAKQAVLDAEAAAAEEKKKFAVIEFAIEAARNVAQGVAEVAKSAGSYPDPVGIATHAIAAASHFTAAGLFGVQAAATASAPTAAGIAAEAGPVAAAASSPGDTIGAGDRGSDGPRQTIVNLRFDGQRLSTDADIADAVATVLDRNASRRGRARFEADSYRRGRRRRA